MWKPLKLNAACLAGTLAACGMSDSIKSKDDLAKETSSDIRLQILSGNDQIGRGGKPLALPLSVQVVDTKGNGVSNQTVSFDIVAGAATIQESSDPVSDVNGQAFVRISPDHGMKGALTVEARISPPLFLEDRHRVLFSAEILPALGPALVIADEKSNGQVGYADSDLRLPLSVRAQDEEGLPISAQTVGFSIKSAPAGTQIASTSSTNSEGVAAATLHLGPLVGAVRVRASWPPDSTEPNRIVEFTATSVPGLPANVRFISGHVNGSSEACTAKNTNYGSPLKLLLTDRPGNPIGRSDVVIDPDGNSGIDGLPSDVAKTIQTDDGGSATFTVRAGDIPWETTYSRSTTITARAVVSAGTPPSASARLQFTQPYFLQYSDGTFVKTEYATGRPTCLFFTHFCEEFPVSFLARRHCWLPYGGTTISATHNTVTNMCPADVSNWGESADFGELTTGADGSATGRLRLLLSFIASTPYYANRVQFFASNTNVLNFYVGTSFHCP